MSREAWLLSLAGNLDQKLFAPRSLIVPKLQLSMGLPSKMALTSRRRRIGECWPLKSGDGVANMFISPLLADPVDVAGTLIHEMVHAVDDCKSGHKGFFRKTAKDIGLEGKMTATTVGAELRRTIEEILHGMEAFPHAALKPGDRKPSKPSRLIHFKCDACGMPIWTTPPWIESEEFSFPCPCGEGSFEKCAKEKDPELSGVTQTGAENCPAKV